MQALSGLMYTKLKWKEQTYYANSVWRAGRGTNVRALTEIRCAASLQMSDLEVLGDM